MRQAATQEFVHRDITLRFKPGHPHAGEIAHPIGDSADTITKLVGPGQRVVYLLEIVNCHHGVERCYAAHADLELLSVGRKR